MGSPRALASSLQSSQSRALCSTVRVIPVPSLADLSSRVVYCLVYRHRCPTECRLSYYMCSEWPIARSNVVVVCYQDLYPSVQTQRKVIATNVMKPKRLWLWERIKGTITSRKNTLQIIDFRWQSAHKPKENHVDGCTGRSKHGGHNAGIPHCRDPPLVGSEDIGIRPTSNDARVAVAVVE